MEVLKGDLLNYVEMGLKYSLLLLHKSNYQIAVNIIKSHLTIR